MLSTRLKIKTYKNLNMYPKLLLLYCAFVKTETTHTQCTLISNYTIEIIVEFQRK